MKQILTPLLYTLVSLTLTNSLYAKENYSVSAENTPAQQTSAFYEKLLQDDNNALLHLFFTKMPKGGDIHHHYSGSIYAETYLDWVEKKGWFIDTCTLHIVKEKKESKCKLLTPTQLTANGNLYGKLLTLWSSKDFHNHYHEQPAPDTNFFNTFSYFETVAYEYMDLGLHILKQRALKENVSYIETILSMVWVDSTQYFKVKEKDYNYLLQEAKTQKETDELLEEITAVYLKSKNFNTTVRNYVSALEKDHQGIDDTNFTMRYQTYAVRVLPPLQVYSNLLAGYEAAEHSELIVGVNIVAPENNAVSLRDYTLHMRMYNYLSRKYPNVHRALHAGELTLGMVRPKNLTFHIEEARTIAKTERIGHGVDISYEDNTLALLKDIKENATVEINFSSNAFILGIKGKEHPYLLYKDYGVPLIIATDDSGVSRNNLTHEYQLLATQYQVKYDTIKSYVYNSITYAFLKEEKKKQLKEDLDKRFIRFEKEMAALSDNLKY
jgi:adenosine deaminase/adenosine deaminase CECR1